MAFVVGREEMVTSSTKEHKVSISFIFNSKVRQAGRQAFTNLTLSAIITGQQSCRFALICPCLHCI